MNEYFIKSKNGKINIIDCKQISNIKAIILHIHGVGSHFQFIYPNLDDIKSKDDFFSKFGYKSIAFEFYGHGKSEGLNCSINNFDDLVVDLKTVVTHINEKYPNIKIFLCAESMGGAVVIKYITNHINLSFNMIKGVILMSPMCGIDDHLKPNPLLIKILIGVSNILPNLQLALTTKKMGSETTVNNEFIIAKSKCKYGFKGPLRLCTVRELFNTSLWIPNNISEITLPILLIHGLYDKITTPSGSINFFDKIKSKDKEILLLPESQHCILIPNSHDDLTPNFTYIKVLSWLESRNM